jgi:ferric-dicitrate binding protein FerR (iron transport regulator)
VADRDGPSREEIEEQAVLRLIALGNDPSPRAEAELAEWIARDPAHAVAFARAELAWEEAARLKGGRAGDDAARPARAAQLDPGSALARTGRRAVKGTEQ